jgi:hypothetical protein
LANLLLLFDIEFGVLQFAQDHQVDNALKVYGEMLEPNLTVVH